MTSYLLRVDDKRALPTSPNVRVLDWHPGRPEATIQTGRDWRYFLAGQTPSRAAAQAMLLGAAVYCADKTSLRADSIDAWTRDITVRTPVADPTPWGAAEWHRPLNFLSGDRWIVSGYESKTPAERTMTVTTDEVDPPGFGEDTVVCLFSGGLDSLSGAIDLLAERDDRRVVLVGHHEGGQAATAQEDLYRRLDHAYPGRLELRQLFLRPAPARPEQARPLPKGSENTQRSRSLLFITAGLMVASTYGPDTPLYVPENGFIGINVPLTRARAGSLSTRTTHPHFFRLLGDALTAAGVTNPIVNPYRLRTKGEIFAGSLDPDLLTALRRAACPALIPKRRVGRRASRATAATASHA